MSREPEEPLLFDLPLAGPPPLASIAPTSAATPSRSEGHSRRSGRRHSRPESLPLFGESEVAAVPDSLPPQAAYVAAPARGPVPVPRSYARDEEADEASARSTAATAAISRRLRATLGDLAILACAGAVAAVGATMLGAELNVRSIPALVVFLLSFSFLYCVVSLAFWGQTPGMAWCGLVARTEETEPLSFGQTALRWLGHWLTWALLGIPGLLALSGRSLADRLSGSSTYETPFSGSSPA